MTTVTDTPPRIRQAVARALRHWQMRQRSAAAGQHAPVALPALEAVLQPLPRRPRLITFDRHVDQVLPSYAALPHSASVGRSLARLLTWAYLIFSIVTGNLFDWLLRRSTVERRATRLRLGLERAGGTFVKFGQQAALRVDLLPWAVCAELSKMLDKMVPFSAEQALRAVERTVGRPWQDVFAVFDPEPIGSASIACVFQAMLKDGTRVAVKVRRPDILPVFLADLQVVDWLAQAAEFMTLLRPGFTKNLRAELRETLLEELDFRREARFQDTFRRNAPKSGRDFFTAARVFFDLSGEEVLVQEFVSGLWLWEVIATAEQHDAAARDLLRQHNIDPLVVAQRIMWVAFWSMDEHIFFHADPHPANILVRDNNELTFIDFGSCGSFNVQQKMALEQMVLAMDRQDAEGMTLATFKLMEPLPPVDVPALSKKFQEGYLRLMHTFNTPAEYTEAWERTSARQWLVLVQVARQFNLPLNLHMLRMIRATLLYDSIVVRLDPELNRHAEYMAFMKDRAALIKKKWRRDLRESAGDAVFLRIEELNDSINDLLLRAQTTLSRPIVEFGSTIDKWVFTISVLGRMLGRVLLVNVLAMAGLYAFRNLRGLPVNLTDLVLDVALSWPYHAFLVVTAALNLRHILFRLRERDERRQRRRE